MISIIYLYRYQRDLHSFPTRRSSDLWREAVNIAMESGARELVLFHHDPDHNDPCIDNIVQEARNYYPKVRAASKGRSEEHTSELQSRQYLVCRLLLENKILSNSTTTT